MLVEGVRVEFRNFKKIETMKIHQNFNDKVSQSFTKFHNEREEGYFPDIEKQN